MKTIYKINQWYDNLPEPRRFLYFFALMLVICTVPFLMSDRTGIIVRLVGLLLISFVRISYVLVRFKEK